MTSITPRKGRAAVTLRWMFEEGQMLRRLRRAARLTQVELCTLSGMTDKQTVSLIETGHRHVPGEYIEGVAVALGLDASTFAQSLLRWQHPWAYSFIFGADPKLQRELKLYRNRA